MTTTFQNYWRGSVEEVRTGANVPDEQILRNIVEQVRALYLAHDPVMMETLDLIRDIKRRLPPQ